MSVQALWRDPSQQLQGKLFLFHAFDVRDAIATVHHVGWAHEGRGKWERNCSSSREAARHNGSIDLVTFPGGSLQGGDRRSKSSGDLVGIPISPYRDSLPGCIAEVQVVARRGCPGMQLGGETLQNPILMAHLQKLWGRWPCSGVVFAHLPPPICPLNKRGRLWPKSGYAHWKRGECN